MNTATPEIDSLAEEHVDDLRAEHAAEEKWSLAGRFVSMAAGSAGIGALVGPEGAIAGAVFGGIFTVLLAALRSRHA